MDVKVHEKRTEANLLRTCSADGEGFEPPVELPPRRFSKPVP